jgi:hypothetical protein
MDASYCHSGASCDMRRRSGRQRVARSARRLLMASISMGLSALVDAGLSKVIGHSAMEITGLCLGVFTTGRSVTVRLLGKQRLEKVTGGLRRWCTEGSILALTGLAGFLAGSRHAHLRDAWSADLYGDPDSGELPSAWRRVRLAAGDVVAAVRCRMDDVTLLAWRPIDKLLASWHGSLFAMIAPVTTAAALVVSHERFYGLVTNAENLACIATASYLAVKGLRHYRQISPPKRPDRRASSEDRTR